MNNIFKLVICARNEGSSGKLRVIKNTLCDQPYSCENNFLLKNIATVRTLLPWFGFWFPHFEIPSKITIHSVHIIEAYQYDFSTNTIADYSLCHMWATAYISGIIEQWRDGRSNWLQWRCSTNTISKAHDKQWTIGSVPTIRGQYFSWPARRLSCTRLFPVPQKQYGERFQWVHFGELEISDKSSVFSLFLNICILKSTKCSGPIDFFLLVDDETFSKPPNVEHNHQQQYIDTLISLIQSKPDAEPLLPSVTDNNDNKAAAYYILLSSMFLQDEEFDDILSAALHEKCCKSDVKFYDASICSDELIAEKRSKKEGRRVRFHSWGGKRSENSRPHNNGRLILPIDFIKDPSRAKIVSRTPFRAWGGKRSSFV